MPNNQQEELIETPTLNSIEEYVSFVENTHLSFLNRFVGVWEDEEGTLAHLNRLKELAYWSKGHYVRLLNIVDLFQEGVTDDRLEIHWDFYRSQRREVIRMLNQERAYIGKLRQKIELEETQYEIGRLQAKRSKGWKRSHPPRNALFLLYLFLGKKGREEAVGDALEDYSRYIKRVGKLRADIIFYQEVGRCAWPFIKRMATKIGGLIVIGEWIRKLTH